MGSDTRTNFEPKSNILLTEVRDFPVANAALLNPTGATCYVDGEWVSFDANGRLVRAAAIAGPGVAATTISFPIWAERGRYDVQTSRKLPIIYLHQLEADTTIYDAALVVGAGAAITTHLQPLKVASITIGARNYCGLVGHGGAADTDPIVGYVSRLPALNGTRLRFFRGWRF